MSLMYICQTYYTSDVTPSISEHSSFPSSLHCCEISKPKKIENSFLQQLRDTKLGPRFTRSPGIGIIQSHYISDFQVFLFLFTVRSR